LLVLSTFLAPSASSQDIQVTLEADAFTAVLSSAMPGAPSGAFSGSLSLNGSPSEIPVTGSAQASPDRLRITVKAKYRDVPEDWANRFRIGDFDYRLRGRVGRVLNIDWSGTKRYDEVEVETPENAPSNFVKLGSIELTQLTSSGSAARAQVTIRNPLSFPLKIASTRYQLSAKGRDVGFGSTKNMILQPAQNTLDLPIEVDHGELLAAARTALRSGGKVDGRLQGTLVIRLPGGYIDFPLDLSGRFSFSK
jgi:LEA14-like dessication related protein